MATQTNWVEFGARWLVYILILMTFGIVGFNFKADAELKKSVKDNRHECNTANVAIVERLHELDKYKVDSEKMDARFVNFAADIKGYVQESENRIMRRLDRMEKRLDR